MRIALIGSQGFLGSKIKKILEQDNALELIEWNRGVHGDFLNELNRQKFVRSATADVVINAGWLSTSSLNYKELEDNLLWARASLNLVELCNTSKLISINFGSAWDESDNTDFYSQAKKLMRNSHERFFGNQVFIRPQIIFSPDEGRPRLLRDALSNELASCILMNPNQYNDFVHVNDVARIVKYVIDADIRGTIYAGSGLTMTNAEFFSYIQSKYFGRGTTQNVLGRLGNLQPPLEAIMTKEFFEPNVRFAKR